MKTWIARLVVVVPLLVLPAASVQAQGDGPRVYQIVPDGTRVVSIYGLFTRGNQSVDPASVIEAGDIAVDVAVVQLGGTVNVTLSRSTSVKVTYGEVVRRNDGGPDGHMTRVVGTWVF